MTAAAVSEAPAVTLETLRLAHAAGLSTVLGVWDVWRGCFPTERC